jgi:hypothetical protein
MTSCPNSPPEPAASPFSACSVNSFICCSTEIARLFASSSRAPVAPVGKLAAVLVVVDVVVERGILFEPCLRQKRKINEFISFYREEKPVYVRMNNSPVMVKDILTCKFVLQCARDERKCMKERN